MGERCIDYLKDENLLVLAENSIGHAIRKPVSWCQKSVLVLNQGMRVLPRDEELL